MKVAIIGSRNIITADIGAYLPDGVTEIVSGGAKGIDACAKEYAFTHHLKYTEFLPDYKRFSKGAPLKRNDKIIDYVDKVVAIWDGISKGTSYVINKCKALGKEVHVYKINRTP